MIATTTEIVPYSRATEIAEKYAKLTAEISRLIVELGENVSELKKTFQFENTNSYDFDLDLEISRTRYKLDADGAAKVIKKFKRDAWKILIEKLGIKKLMSQKESEKLNSQLYDDRSYNHGEKPAELPEINAETIISVMQGMVSSAPEYLTEKIKEVYQWLIPHQWSGGYKTNQRDRVGKKVIKPCMVSKCWSGKGFEAKYYNRAHLSALDLVFHTLSGAGIPPGQNGPLVDTIATCPDGKGETDFFKFKCFGNGNIHIEFKREDLLKKFNAVAVDGKHVGAEMARK